MGRYWPGMGSNLRPDLKKLPRVVAIGRSATFVGGTQSSGSVLGLTPSFNPQFAATGSIADTRGNGVPAFLRNTVATVEDHEGILRYALAGEVRFKGLRRVQNLLSATENFADPAWSTGDPVNNPIIPNSPDVAAPDGTFTATKFQINSIALNRSFSQAVGTTTLPGRTFSFSFWVWIPNSNSPNPWSAYMFTGLDIPVDPVNLNALPRSRWNRVTYKHTWSGAATNGVSAQFHGNFADTVGDKIYVWHPQLEEITGQSIQIPAEYVSTGVQVAPIYHGAAIDGVKYFPWTNGNTVNGNIVTEAFGTVIPLGANKGYLNEPLRVNRIVQSNKFSDATWGVSQVAVTDNVDTFPFTDATADKISELAVNAEHYIEQPGLTFIDNTVCTFSIYAKPAERNWLRISVVQRDNVTVIGAYFDVTNGVTGNADAGVTSKIVPGPNGSFRCIITCSVGAGAFNARMRISLATGNGAALIYLGIAGSGLKINEAQAEIGVYETTIIHTDGAPVQRNSDALSYTKPPEFNSNGTWYFAWTPRDNGNNDTNRRYLLCGTDAGLNRNCIREADGTVQTFPIGVFGNGVVNGSPVSPANQTPNILNKCAMSFDPTKSIAALNGVIGIVTTGYIDVNSFATLFIGQNQNDPTIGQTSSPIAEIRLYPYTLTDSMLQQLTT